MTATAKRVGRPRNPPAPRMPEPYERPEYVARLQTILDALEISDLTKEVWLYLQKMLQRCDRLRSIDPKLAVTGEEKITILLRTIFESTNGAAALTLRILMAVSNCMRPAWVDRGLAWIEAFDHIDLVELNATLTDLGLSDQLERALFKKLENLLGPPVLRAQLENPPALRAKRRPKRMPESERMAA